MNIATITIKTDYTNGFRQILLYILLFIFKFLNILHEQLLTTLSVFSGHPLTPRERS